MKEKQLTLADLRAAMGAMDSWLDAFGEENEHMVEAERVKRVLEIFAEIEARMAADPLLSLAPTKPEIH